MKVRGLFWEPTKKDAKYSLITYGSAYALNTDTDNILYFSDAQAHKEYPVF